MTPAPFQPGDVTAVLGDEGAAVTVLGKNSVDRAKARASTTFSAFLLNEAYCLQNEGTGREPMAASERAHRRLLAHRRQQRAGRPRQRQQPLPGDLEQQDLHELRHLRRRHPARSHRVGRASQDENARTAVRGDSQQPDRAERRQRSERRRRRRARHRVPACIACSRTSSPATSRPDRAPASRTSATTT